MKKEQRKKNKEQVSKNKSCLSSAPHSSFLIPHFSLLIAHFSLLICSCDLFNGPVQPHFLAKIDEEIAWSNAARLTVRIDYPSVWGNSNPAAGPIAPSPMDIRQGYPFDVEFTSLPGFGFEEWLAFRTDDYNKLDLSKSSDQVKGSALKTSEVIIVGGVNATGAQTAKITINTTTPVSIVPWCGNKPRLNQQTNPPLTPLAMPFPYDQRVNIWFNMSVKRSTIELGKTIVVTGINMADNATHGQRGQPFNGDGDLNSYFNLEFPGTGNVQRVTLVPKADTASDLALLSISVTVGPDIESANGIKMAGAEIINYQTDSSQAQKVYRSENIAAQKMSQWFEDSATYPWNSPSIDRRFKLGASIPIRFNVTAPEGAPSIPNRIKIIERKAYDLRGYSTSGVSETEYSGTGITQSGGYYNITHTLKTGESGIIQLIVLPWYSDATSPINPLEINTAISEGQYVTIVIDVAPPGLANLGASLNAPSSREAGTGIYVYGIGTEIILTIGELRNLVDNGTQGGIPASQAWGLPWTMDEVNKLFWHVRIGEETQAERIASPKLNVYNGAALNNAWKPGSITGLTDPGGYRVYVKFEDSMGNISLDWIDTEFRVKYSTAQILAVTNLSAECNASGTLINVTWTQPADYLNPEVVIRRYRADAAGDTFENETRQTLGKVGNYSFGVSSINTNNVRIGNAVTGVIGYEITVITHNTAGTAETGPIWVYNIPGMKTTSTGTDAAATTNTVQITSGTQLTVAAADLGKNIVLTRDITASSHTPIGTGSGAAAFTGKFYGNGHTVTINSFATGASGNMGLFGVTGTGAIIRDLTVNYSNVSFSHTNSLNFGGILGSPNGAAQLINVLTKGDVSINGSNNGSVTNDISVGGIIGFVDFSNSTGNPEASINNAHMGLNLSVKNNGTVSTDATGNSLNIGGIGGRLRTYAGNNVNNGIMRIENVTVVGNITVGDTTNRVVVLALNVGGLVGYWGGVFAANLDYKGELTAWCGNGTLRLGGAAGYIGSSNGNDINNCVIMQKGIEVTKTGTGDIYIGGFLGEYMGYEDLKNCYSEGPVVVNAQGGTKAVGGFVGKISGQVLYCYSKGDVKVSSTGGDVYAGGFCGWQSISAGVGVNFAIQYSYAMGNVNATGRGTFHAGGFAGMVERTVNDCYSTGNVFVDLTGADDIMAGGLIGYASLFQSYQAPENSYPFFHCFATGAVAAHRNGNATTSAGGLVGAHRPSNSVYITTTIRDCAALGVSVTVTGAGTRNIGRLYGNDYPATRFVLTKNRAFSDMGLYQSGTYKSANPTPQVPASDHENIDGADVSFSGIRYIDFWKNSTPDSGPTLATHGLGFSDADWIFTTVGYLGYPTLRESKYGPAMGGQ